LSINQERWNIEEDGSLRNKGKEFITLVPSSREELLEDFVGLHKSIRYTPEEAFSERTSVHVHVNCLELSEQHVKNILHYYALFEPVFFKIVEKSRANNIHCVALTQTQLPEHYRRPLKNIVNTWSKYTALNLVPLQELGTIEFRHLYGTCDVQLITNWICLLGKMVEYAQKIPLSFARESIVQMNTVSNYHEWLYSVFGDYISLLQAPNFEKALSKGVVDTKLMLMEEKPVKYKDIDLNEMLRDYTIAPNMVIRGGLVNANNQAQRANLGNPLDIRWQVIGEQYQMPEPVEVQF